MFYITKLSADTYLRARALNLAKTRKCWQASIGSARISEAVGSYQTTHDRAFHKALNTLLKLRADKKKAEIGFVSQQRQAEEHARKQAVEKRKQELHKWKVLQAQAEVDHRILRNVNLQTPENRITVGPQHIIAAEKAA